MPVKHYLFLSLAKKYLFEISIPCRFVPAEDRQPLDMPGWGAGGGCGLLTRTSVPAGECAPFTLTAVKKVGSIWAGESRGGLCH